MSGGLTLEERAATDPALQRVLKTYREMCHNLAQDYWREFLELSVTSGREAALIYMTKFQEVIVRKATEYEAESGIAGIGERYLAYIQEERDRLLQEYQRDPGGLRRSLGAPSLPQMPAATPNTSQRMSIGEMAVRTAVRATVWTLIRDAIRSVLR